MEQAPRGGRAKTAATLFLKAVVVLLLIPIPLGILSPLPLLLAPFFYGFPLVILVFVIDAAVRTVGARRTGQAREM